MSFTKEDRNFRSENGNSFPAGERYNGFVDAVALAIKAEFGATPSTAKRVARLVSANERCVRNWLDGKNGPRVTVEGYGDSAFNSGEIGRMVRPVRRARLTPQCTPPSRLACARLLAPKRLKIHDRRTNLSRPHRPRPEPASVLAGLSFHQRPWAADERTPPKIEPQQPVGVARNADPDAAPDFAGFGIVDAEP